MHEPLNLLQPVPFRGDVARSLTLAPVTADRAAAMVRAGNGLNKRAAVVAGIAVATDCPRDLIAKLADADLIRAGDWVAGAYRRETMREAEKWPR